MSTIAEQLQEAADKASQASAQAGLWATGPVGTTVPTDSGPVPTIAEFTRSAQERADDAIGALGWLLAGDFTAGCTVTERNQYVLVVGGSGYRWDGALPKVVAPGSDPTPIDTGAWVLVGDATLRGELANTGGSGLVAFSHQAAGAVHRTVEGKLRDTISVKDFGAIGDGITDDSASFNAFTAYLRQNYVNTTYDYTGVNLLIPPGIYSVSSWDLTDLYIHNLHIVGHGAVIMARTGGKNVIDGLGSRYLKFHGLTVYSTADVMARSGVQLGPKGVETCGNACFNDVNILGYFTHAPYMNLGSETTSLFNTRFVQRNTDPAAFAQICDGMSKYLPTSDFVTVTRPVGVVLSYTANSYNGCQIRNEGGGSASYLSYPHGWEFDMGCYYISFNDSAFVIHGNTTYRPAKLVIRGSFESSLDDNPTPGNIGIRHAVTFSNEGGNTAIDGFTFEASNLQCATSVFRVTGGGSCRLSDADIRVHTIPEAGCVLVGSGSLNIDGVLMSQNAAKLNLGALTVFNGIICTNNYNELPSLPPIGGYTVYSRIDSKVYHCGEQAFVSAPFTFTPTVTFATPGDLSVSYAAQVGYGYRIGKMVFVSVTLTFTPTHTTASGDLIINGLPFSSAIGSSRHSGLHQVSINSGFTWPESTTQVCPRVPENSTKIKMYAQGSGVATVPFTTANLPSGTAKAIVFSGMYLAS